MQGKPLLALCCVSLCASMTRAADAPVASGAPDPAAVQQYGPAYRYPQAGWIVLHIEGQPYERGYQHGRLLAPEILDFLKASAAMANPQGHGGVATSPLCNAFMRQCRRIS